MTYKLFIDDERFPVDESFIIARSSEEAIEIVKNRGIPIEIAFDHDLGGDDDSIRFLSWLYNELCEGNWGSKLPEQFIYSVHSQNPIGVKRIYEWMKDILCTFKEG
jgi:hypothetical protein